jgi:predicted unusual protein kinase regulating ubiquinone biosynthesis (AarF/ABC1/UbiB family)
MFKILEKIYDKVNNLASEEAKEWVERQANEKYEEIFGECEE